MRYIIIMIMIYLILISCATHAVNTVTSGEIEQIAHFNGQTYVKFVGDKKTYVCDQAPWHNVGGWVEIVKTEKGCVFQ